MKMVELFSLRNQSVRWQVVVNACRLACCCLFLFLTLMPSNVAHAQKKAKLANSSEPSEPWEYSPYRIKIWVAFEQGTPFINRRTRDDVRKQIPELGYLQEFSAWRLTVEEAPVEYQGSILHRLEGFDFTKDERDSEQIEKGDKIILLGVKRGNRSFQITAREFDCPTRVWGPIVTLNALTAESIPRVCYRAVESAFVPVARLLQLEKKAGLALPRAGGLMVYPEIEYVQVPDPSAEVEEGAEPKMMSESRLVLMPNSNSPAWISVNDVCVPVMRRSLRKKVDGKTVNIVATMDIDWTYAFVESVKRNNEEPILDVTIYSAKRSPMGGATGRRTERILRLVKPQRITTTLKLVNKKDPPDPLSGYEVHSVKPGSTASELLGKTDWRGAFEVKQHQDYPLRILYVRSGSRILARLPMVPGYYEERSQAMFNDEVRIRAEGVIRGMSNNLLDLIARRQTLTVQTEGAIAKKDFERAQTLLSDLVSLKSGKDFLREIDGQARRFESKDVREQSKINKMFSEINRLVNTHLKPTAISELQNKLNDAKEGKLPPPPAEDSGDSESGE